MTTLLTLLILLAQTLTIGAGGGDLVVSGGTGTFEPDPYFNRIPLYYTAGRVAFTCGGTAAGTVRWESHGKYLTALAFDSTFTSSGVVYLETNLANPTLTITGSTSGARFVGDLSVFRRFNYYLKLLNCTQVTGNLSSVSAVTYYLDLYNCPQVTGNLSSVSAVTYYLDLLNCPQVTGNLSSVSAVTYYLRLYDCPQVTGNLSSVSAVTYYLDLYNCTQVTGNLSSVSAVTYYLRLANCALVTGTLNPKATLTNVLLNGCTGISTADMSQSLVNLAAVSTVTSEGTFQANHIKRSQLTPAAELAVQHLVAAPHNWAMTFKAE
jgi:hypothetical protein